MSLAETYARLKSETQSSRLYSQLVEEAQRRIDAQRPYVVETASQVLLEQRVRALEMLSPTVTVVGLTGVAAPEKDRISLANAILQAKPVLWEEDIRQSVAQLKLPLPLDCATIKPIDPIQFWTWPSDLRISEENTDGVLEPLKDLCGLYQVVTTDPEWFGSFLVACRAGTREMVVFGQRVSRIEPYAVADERRALLSMLIYMASPYVPVDSRRLSRAEARAAGYRNASALPEIRFVTLRKAMSCQAQREEQELSEAQQRIYRHRWLVSGHIRNQWYPGEQTHKPLFIPPHMKGPSTGELLLKVARVHR